MKALIVDDEPPARRELRRLLRDFAWLEVVGECGHIADAERFINVTPPDLVFLDIQMPGGTGFDLLTRLEHVPPVIFTTAHDEHAVHAFEVNALDYLLKPIDPVRLAAALSRVRQQTAPPAARSAGGALEQLFIRDGAQCWFVPLRDVRLLSSEGNYVRLSWGARRPLLARALTALEQRLDERRFFRANRAQIINLDFIDSVEAGASGRLHVQLRDGPEVEISRRQARQFKARLSL